MGSAFSNAWVVSLPGTHDVLRRVFRHVVLRVPEISSYSASRNLRLSAP